MGIGFLVASRSRRSARADRHPSAGSLAPDLAAGVRAGDAKRDALRRVPGLPLPERLRDRVAWSVARPRVSRWDRTWPTPACYAKLAQQTA